MTRIVAGDWGGRRLTVAGGDVRPTSERVREAIFNSLAGQVGDWEAGDVLDLFAGSGALGLEALSRGARRAVFVERDRRAVANLRRNVAALDAGDRARVVARPVLPVVPGASPCRVVFADPPYRSADQLPRVFADYLAAGWFAPGCVVVAETAADADPPWPAGIQAVSRRRYGDTAVWYGRSSSPNSEDGQRA